MVLRNTLFSSRSVPVCMCSVMSNSLQPQGLSPTRLLCSWDFSGKNTRVGCCFLLQGIFPTQGLNPCLLWLLHCRKILYLWATAEAPKIEYYSWSCLIFEAPALKSSRLIFRNYIVRHLIHWLLCVTVHFLCMKSELYFINPLPVFIVRLVYISSVFYIIGKVLFFPEFSRY